MAPNLVGCQALTCADAVGCFLVWPDHKAAGCRILCGPGARAGSLVGGVRVSKTPEFLPAHWWAEARSSQAELIPGVWLQGPGIPELISDHWWEELIPDTVGYEVCSVPNLTFAC